MGKLTFEELAQLRRQNILKYTGGYKMRFWSAFNYRILTNIMYRFRPGSGDKASYNDVIIMADTETSKKPDGEENHICAWTISLRAYGMNIATLWGRTPSDFCECIRRMQLHMYAEQTIIYVHNLSYDWQFLRGFLFRSFGLPSHMLATKPHYPIYIEFETGLVLRDSLILAQRSLDKWAKDLGADHQKAVGFWEYGKLRNQKEYFTKKELIYIEHDTLAGVECLDILRASLGKKYGQMPYTATGIPREQVRKLANANHQRELFSSCVMTYDLQVMAENVYHGGYTHANRHQIGCVWPAVCYDFASSYPFVLLSEKYPMSGFAPLGNKSIDFILEYADRYCFMFKLIMVKPRLKNDLIPMPALQYSKCVNEINSICDNGRILCADYIEIYLNEIDLQVIAAQYDYNQAICCHVYEATKDYLPKWFTSYIFQKFEEKTRLKGGDPVAYALAKSVVNSIYGMCVQHPVRDELAEDYVTGEYYKLELDPRGQYEKYVEKKSSVLLYQWGVWCTSYAFRNLFDMGSCVADDGIWLYSDTDSCYATKWNMEKLEAYNQRCKDRLQANGFGPVLHNGREYWLGICEKDKVCTEFSAQGAKRYCYRSEEDGQLHITVAGVPKSGAAALNDDIRNFKPGMIFPGTLTNKLTHKYIMSGIYTDQWGNETADSIDLSPCDYLLDGVRDVDWESLFTEEINIQIYEEEDVKLE